MEDWIITGFPLSDISRLDVSNNDSYAFSSPGFFHGTFTLPESYSEPLDTFLDPTGWGKVIFFNNVSVDIHSTKDGQKVSVQGAYICASDFDESLVWFIKEEHRKKIIFLRCPNGN